MRTVHSFVVGNSHSLGRVCAQPIGFKAVPPTVQSATQLCHPASMAAGMNNPFAGCIIHVLYFTKAVFWLSWLYAG
jgi:hypothetical protein